jgi:hypothetical protein
MNWPEFAKRLLLADGKITAVETKLLRRAIVEDGVISRDEVEFLIDLKRSATAVVPAFDRFLFAVIKRLVLKDGVISDTEAAWLERTIFGDRMLVTDMTIRFLKALRAEAKEVGPRFARLYAKWVPEPLLARVVNSGRPAPAAHTPPTPAPGGPPARPRTGTRRS